MILYKGKIYENTEQSNLISKLKSDMTETISKGTFPSYEKVIKACDVIYRKVMNHEYDDIILPLLEEMNIPFAMLDNYAKCFSEKGLMKKVETELSDLLGGEKQIDESNTRKMYPLGILFHIPAGNMDLLPSYSVIEGLLTGNINILKLPSGDKGLSVRLLKELIDIEPELSDYVYVFDVPSIETDTIKQLADMSDGVIVWGGDGVSSAARQFTDIHSSLIIWGHKISFDYADENITDEELVSIAKSVCMTNQLLCSSVQGIYLNTDKIEDLRTFAKRFCTILAQESEKSGTMPLTMKAKNTLIAYNGKLEGEDQNIFIEKGVSVYVSENPELELSHMYRNVWVKPLLKDEIVKVLKKNKNILQSVGVSENVKDKEEIIESLISSGVVRITKPGETSRMIPGEAHDGEYPLRRYIRIVERYK